jgi:tRNA(adenine34) deaminase
LVNVCIICSSFENNKIIAAAYNQNRFLCDPSAHAEILALRLAAQNKKSPRLDGCDLYVTLEPCAMCAGAISLARIKNLYYAAADSKFGAVENGVNFFASKSCHHRVESYSGIGEIEAKNLMVNFFKMKR